MISNYFPKDTNLIVNIYQAVKDSDFAILQNHIWNYTDPEEREARAEEFIIAALEVLDEPSI